MSFTYEDFYLSGFNTGTIVSGIQAKTPLYWIVTGLKYDGTPVTINDFSWFTGISIAGSGTISPEQSGFIGYDSDNDDWRGIITFDVASGITATGILDLYWNSGVTYTENVVLIKGFDTFSNFNEDAWNTVSKKNDSVDNADGQHTHTIAQTLSGLTDVLIPPTIDDGDALIYSTESGAWTTGEGAGDGIDPTGYETVSGDYIITSGTIEDYKAVSGDYTTTSGNIDDYTTVSGVVATSLQNISEDTDPQLGGNLDLNQKSIVIDPTPTSNNTYNGIVVSGTVDDASTVFGNLLYKAADGNWERADASTVATMPAQAMSLGAGAGTYGILLYGVIRHDDWNWSQVGGTGDMLYVSETPGDPTQTMPSGSEVNVQIIGFALSDDEIMFKPDNAYGTWEA